MTPWIVAGLVAFGLCVTPLARPGAETPAAPPEAPVVVELFTSQSCYSCPPAEAYLGRLAARPDIVALEYHVDYWNDLVYGASGKWNDVHSSPAFTARQRSYAARLPGGVYTPQMVIDGQAQAVGSRETEVEAAIREARKRPRLGVEVRARDTGRIELRLHGDGVRSDTTAEVWLMRFQRRVETRIRGGENRGKLLANHHIVTAMTRLGSVLLDGGSVVLDAGAPVLDGESCAILVQMPGQGPMLGAYMCRS